MNSSDSRSDYIGGIFLANRVYLVPNNPFVDKPIRLLSYL